MTSYFRPLVQFGPSQPKTALPLAGGPMWFSQAMCHRRNALPECVDLHDIPKDVLHRLTAARAPFSTLALDQPRLMGILNVTPDSFSDGGQFHAPADAIAQARILARDGADIIDIGGESTRPGAEIIPPDIEIARTAPVIRAIRSDFGGLISIDTRKGDVARASCDAGADIVNDVSALTFDAAMAGMVREFDVPICLMHAQGTPETMQHAPQYDDVVLDVYDSLARRVEWAVSAGVRRDKIIIDPGIGFGKTLEHNLTLLAHLSLFHGLGCAILLGASRKRFIGTLGGAENPQGRAAGSVGVALAGVAQGVQILRVHDMAETKQALTLWWAATTGTSA
ncbi:dihydropteroate synthase [Oceaniglobus ichthyenteri]|uniref:dihydropteroate synthase n=1 Tax=Oceaniglobus ichthyenteri TaxID=2136177 RepID=UPI000D354449|nr:dihydropteroate synthase [Oceaniglobus ichthyenteri]